MQKVIMNYPSIELIFYTAKWRIQKVSAKVKKDATA